MKNLSTAWKNYLASGGSSLAMCIKVTLQSGAVYGFTTASREIDYNGVLYYPAMGVNPSVIESGGDMSPGNMEAVGFFAADGVLMEDVRAGRFNSATHETIIVNYDDLSMGHIHQIAGPLGQFKSNGNQFTFELKDWLDNLTLKTGFATTPYCRVKRLGDSVCGVKVNPSLSTTSLSTSYLDAAGKFDLPFNADGVNVNIMNDGRLIVSMYNAALSTRETTIRDPLTLNTVQLLPDLGSDNITKSGVLINQFGDMCNGKIYRKSGLANVTIGVDTHTPCVMGLDGRFYVACKYVASPYTPALVIVQLDGTFTVINLPDTHTPKWLWHGQNGYVYLHMDNGGTGPMYKIDATTGAIVKTSTLLAQFMNFVVASDDSVWYVNATGAQWSRMEPTWASATSIFTYGVVGADAIHETWGRNWASGGVIGGFNTELRHYSAAGTLIESIASPGAITAYKIVTHPTYPDKILYSDTRSVGGTGNRFVAQVLRPVGGQSAVWTPFTAVIAKATGDAKVGSAVKPSTFNGLHYLCTTAGVTGSSEPAWSTTLGAETTDGSAKWTGVVARTWVRTVATVTDGHTFTVSGAGTPAVNLFKYGIVRWLTGANAGVELEVMSNTATSVTTYLPTPEAIQVGDTCEIERGCDRSSAVCTAEFSNIFNFDGEPHKPAADFLLSYSTR